MYGHYRPRARAKKHFTARLMLTKLGIMEGHERGVSKRQLGAFMALVGIIGFGAILAIDVVDVGREGGIGPAQTIALALMAVCAIIGLSLIPLGDAPA